MARKLENTHKHTPCLTFSQLRSGYTHRGQNILFPPTYRGLLKESTSTLRVNVLNSSFHPVLVDLQRGGDVELVKLSGHMTAGNSNSMHIIVLLDDPGPRHGPG